LHVGLIHDELLESGTHDGVVVCDQDADHGLWRVARVCPRKCPSPYCVIMAPGAD
jgi:hypothetical protein